MVLLLSLSDVDDGWRLLPGGTREVTVEAGIEPVVVVPAITGVDGDGSALPVTGALPDDGEPAAHRLAESLVVSGTDLDVATEAQLRHPEPTADTPCLAGPGADPCVVHDASTGLLLLPGDAAQRAIALPPALAAGAYVLALIAPSGEAHAQVFVLQGEPGEPGLDCWDTDEDRQCDLDSEDVDGDGACTALDCRPVTPLQCTGPDCVLNRNLLVAGDLTSTATVTGDEVAAGATALGATAADHEARLQTLEADPTTATDLAAVDARLATVEGDYATGTQLSALDARVAAIEADFATATELASLDGRVSVVELDYATATALAGVDARVTAIETNGAAASEITSLDSRISAIEADYATDTDLAALDTDVATLDADLVALTASASQEIKANTTWTVPGDYATVVEAWSAAKQWRIAPGAMLTIEVTGTHAVASQLAWQHPDGHRVHLVGGSMTAGTDVLEFSGTGGILVQDTSLGMVSNLTLRGTGAGTGVYANHGGQIVLDSDVVVEDFQFGVRAITGGVVYAEGVQVSNMLDECFVASQQSVIYANNATADGCATGLLAASGSTIVADSVTATGCGQFAFWAQGEASIDVSNASGESESHCAYAAMSASIRGNNLTCIIDTPTDDSAGNTLFAQHHSLIISGGSELLEAEQGDVINSSQGSTVVAWGGRTLRGDGPWIIDVGTDSGVRAEDAILDGAYTGTVRLLHQSFARFNNVTNPNGAPSSVDAGSVLIE